MTVHPLLKPAGILPPMRSRTADMEEVNAFASGLALTTQRGGTDLHKRFAFLTAFNACEVLKDESPKYLF